MSGYSFTWRLNSQRRIIIINICEKDSNMSRQTNIPPMFLEHIIISDVKTQTEHDVLLLFFFFLLCFSLLHDVVASETHLLILKGKIIAKPHSLNMPVQTQWRVQSYADPSHITLPVRCIVLTTCYTYGHLRFTDIIFCYYSTIIIFYAFLVFFFPFQKLRGKKNEIPSGLDLSLPV
jgi:hypothetical protein